MFNSGLRGPNGGPDAHISEAARHFGIFYDKTRGAATHDQSEPNPNRPMACWVKKTQPQNST